MSWMKTLLRAKYDPNFYKLEELEVVIRHRGAPGDVKIVPGSKIVNVQKDGFYYINEAGEEIFIPGHRILEIRKKN